MLRVVLVGLGAIGQGLLPLLLADARVAVVGVVVRQGGLAAARAHLAGLAGLAGLADPSSAAPAGRPQIGVACGLADLPPADLLVECAGHQAIGEHVLPALARGLPCVVASVGALADDGLAGRLEAAAAAGGSRLQLVAGAIGAIDALASARLGGLREVRYTGTKPALAWRGTPADTAHALDSLAGPTVIFEGSAREAARRFPRNANVAATVALAGLGLDATQVRLVADPQSQANIHQLQANGSFGQLDLTLRGQPLAGNAKTSALTVFSLARAVRDRAALVSF